MKKSQATEALRVASDVAAIGAALDKRAKQSAWTVCVTTEHHYLLTYQPTPISSWILHPQNNDSDRHTPIRAAEPYGIAIIQNALTKRPTGIAGSIS